MSEFWKTKMGRELLDGHVPTFVRTLKSLVVELARANDLQESNAYQVELVPLKMLERGDLLVETDSRHTAEVMEVRKDNCVVRWTHNRIRLTVSILPAEKTTWRKYAVRCKPR